MFFAKKDPLSKNKTAMYEQKSKAPFVKVLGSGCAKCRNLEKATREALFELGINTPIEHITDYTHIASYGVLSVPALVVEGKVVSDGKLLSKDEIKDILKDIAS